MSAIQIEIRALVHTLTRFEHMLWAIEEHGETTAGELMRDALGSLRGAFRLLREADAAMETVDAERREIAELRRDGLMGPP